MANYTVTLTVQNIGTGPTTADRVASTTLPSGWSYVSNTGGYTQSQVGQALTLTKAGALAAGASESFGVVLAIADAAIDGAASLSFTVATVGDAAAGNNAASLAPVVSHATWYEGGFEPTGVPLATRRSAAQTHYNYWKTYVLTQTGMPAGMPTGAQRVKVPDQNDPTTGLPNGTFSEGIGYGMLITAQMGRPASPILDNAAHGIFDALWTYAKFFLNANGVMNWRIDHNGNITGFGGATDGDQDIAMGLLLAHRNWGSAGAINYMAEAQTLIDQIDRTEFTTNTVYVKTSGAAAGATQIPILGKLTRTIPSGTVLTFASGKTATLNADAGQTSSSLPINALAVALLSGDTTTYLATSATPQHIMTNGDQWGFDADRYMPDYFSPGMYRAFAAVRPGSRWGNLIADGYTRAVDYFQAAFPTGMVPDQSNRAGGVTGAESYIYGYNSIRRPFRVALDYLWYPALAPPNAQATLLKLANFVRDPARANQIPANSRAEWNLAGTASANYVNPAYVSGYGIAGTADPTTAAWAGACFQYLQTNSQENSYFGTNLSAIAMLILAGEFKKP